MDSTTLRTTSVMIVEDDLEAREIICRMLAKKFPRLTQWVADNGAMGLQEFAAHRPEIVITDIHMPVMDGIAMAEAIRGESPDTKFIVLTGYSDQEYLKKFREIGFHDYIVKPVDFRHLLHVVAQCCQELMAQ